MLSSLASLAVAATLLFGPPWIAIEYPANPLDPATRDAFLVVRTYHHERLAAATPTGRAEGTVDGRRQSVTLGFDATTQPGVYALRRTWPAEGRWVLVISSGPREGAATAVVGVADGEVRSVRVPSRREGRWTIPVVVTDADVEGMFRTLASR